MIYAAFPFFLQLICTNFLSIRGIGSFERGILYLKKQQALFIKDLEKTLMQG